MQLTTEVTEHTEGILPGTTGALIGPLSAPAPPRPLWLGWDRAELPQSRLSKSLWSL
jgi:hypothetical protein